MFTQTNPINSFASSDSSTHINEPIEVLVHFSHTGFKPFRFLWKNHSYQVDFITTQYQTRDGGISYLHFAALSSSNLYELIYNLNDHTWKIKQASTP